jgi:two-component system, NarL family, sensor histidine kinase UhpB
MATSSSPIKNKKGHPLSLRQFISTNQETFFNRILDSTGDIRFLLDDQLRLPWFNKPAQDLYQKLTGKRLTQLSSISELLKPSELEQFMGYLSQVYSGKSLQFDYKFNRDSSYWVNIALFPFSFHDGEVAGVYGVARTINKEKEVSKNRPEAEIEHQKEISRLILKAEEEERGRLGRELHDNINQILAAVKIQLSHCLDNYSKGKPIIEKCHSHLREVMDEIRKLSHNLVLPGFNGSNLTEEVKKLVETYHSNSAIDIDLSHFNEQKVNSNLKEVFFRIIQEQLNNIIKHAKATKILLKLETKSDTIRLKIEDNGIGFDTSGKRNGIGIINIFNRAELEGGKAQIKSGKGKGCCLLVTIPMVSE